MADKPDFISRDLDAIQKETIARYEELVGRKLQPAQPERLLLNTLAYRESLLRSAIQDAAVQNLVEFSTAPVLDFLADIVGVSRLAPAAATVDMEFTKVEGSGGVTVPAGTRVRSNDGEVVFATLEALDIDAGELTGTVIAEATTSGQVGNGYIAGEIENILDPESFISEATNTSESVGGSDQETDEALRERIKASPDSFSVAGPRGAYEFLAKSASASIVDVSVVTPGGGIIQIYPLVAGGIETPQAVLDAVDEIASADDARPLSDVVEVLSPDMIEYTLAVGLTLETDADEDAVQAEVESILGDLVESKYQQLGLDLTTSEVIQQARIDGVYSVSVEITGPSGVVENLAIGENEFAVSTQTTVTIDGTI